MTLTPRVMSAQALCLLTFFTLAWAGDFEIHEADNGDFGLALGDPQCPVKVRFNDDDPSMKAEDIEINNQPCTGGTLLLVKNPDTGGSLLTVHLRTNNDRDDSFEGVFTSAIVCGEGAGSTQLVRGTYVQLFSPKDDITVNMATVLGVTSPLGKASGASGNDNGQNFVFRKDQDYLILGAECVFSRASFSPALCFPSEATVELDDGRHRRMDSLAIGDRVRTGAEEFSPIFGFTHRDANAVSNFVEITTDTVPSRSLTLTPGHYLYVNGGLAPASTVREKDEVLLSDGVRATVQSVRRKQAEGLYNPQTLQGDIVVNGIVSSTYTTAVEPVAAHAILTPLRALYRWLGISSEAFESGAGVFEPYLPRAFSQEL